MSLILDNFLSQLGAIISSGIHHLVVPPTPLFQTYYNKRIIFQIFIIKDHNVILFFLKKKN